MNGLEIEELGGYCPCQGFGTFDKQPFYFRARHGSWTLEVYENATERVIVFRLSGDDPDYGCMESEKARLIIEAAYSAYCVWIGKRPAGC